MRILRSTILAIGLMALAGACGGKDKGAAEPAATDTAAPAEGAPAEGAAPAEGEANPCNAEGGEANPCQPK
jgi:hypothetical protein